MTIENVRKLVNQIVDEDNIEAGDSFKTLMQDKQADAIDLKRVEAQLSWLDKEPEIAEIETEA